MAKVELAIDERGVATITLNRPERLNAIDLEMRDLLWEHLRACADIPEVAVIIFRGEGRAFSAGADISEFGTAPSVMAARASRHDRDLWWALLNHRCVTIAGLHGFCFGAGLELPLCCDIRVASTDATFALPEVTLGYIPSAGGTQTLPRLAPPGIAASMILTGEAIDSPAAFRWGLIDARVDAVDLDATVDEVAEACLSLDRAASARARRLGILETVNAAAVAAIRP